MTPLDFRTTLDYKTIEAACNKFPGLTVKNMMSEDIPHYSKLIESLCLQIPPQKIYISADYNNNYYSFIKKDQLFDALVYFIKGCFELKGLEVYPEYNGKDFENLPRLFQRRLTEQADRAQLRVHPRPI